MTAPAPAFATRDTSGAPAPEGQIIRDLVRRGLKVAPLALLVGLLGWNLEGLASVALALALVLGNFVAAAALQSWAARISYALVMGVALFGFLIRLGIISGVVLLVGDQPWIEPLPLGLTLVVGHLGLLVWETRFVSASLAFPGLKPDLVKE
ncbi:MAG TPA: ATP synthase subunit I [Acidimicrobiales bacterium]|nr:ATP synthase subunit I [Acidimicrobiales bacterium]